ncbi:MAG TPA: hypothetical protein VEA58_05430 [Anaerovoracaceae bacterium]|nr:hypothetical protein [Anaerovoracaceae bacterium]
MDFAYREEQRKRAELARLANERAQAQKDARLSKYKEIKQAAPTGIGSIDQALATWADQAMDKALELYKKEAAGQTLTPQEQAMYKKIETLPDTLALMTKAYTGDAARYAEGVKSGKIKRDLDYELKLQKLPKQAVAFLDDDLNPVLGMDNDGDGQPDIISFDMNGLSLQPNIVENVNLEDYIKSVSDNLHTTRTVTDQNFTKRTSESLPLKTAQSTARNMVYNADGSLTPLTKSYFYDAGIRTADQVTPEQLDSFEKFLTERLINSQKQVSETDVDYGAKISQQRENRLSEDEDELSVGNPVTPSKQTWGDQYNNIDTAKVRSVPVTKKLILPGLQVKENKKNTTIGNAQVLNYTYDKNGNLLIDISYSEGTISADESEDGISKSLVNKKRVTATRETESRIAKELGMTLEQFREAAQVEQTPLSQTGSKYN